MIHLTLIAMFSLLPSIVLAQSDAGTRDSDRERLREQSQKLRDEARKMREASREQMRMVKEQMRDVDRQMRELAREQRRRKLYPRLGVTVKSDTHSGDATTGVVVQEVVSGGPAQKAGIRAGDILTAINGQPLVDSADAGVESAAHAVGKLMSLLYASKPGEKVRVDYQRGSEKRHVDVALEGPGEGWVERSRMHEMRVPAIWMDLQFVGVNRELGEYFGTDHGVLVVRGTEMPQPRPKPSPRENALRGGDIILKIGNQEPQTPVEAVRLLRSYESGKPISVQILRHKKSETLTVQTPDHGDR
jgi:S1-C subfamily serine protease